MRWYHSLIAGMAALLIVSVFALAYVIADRQSGGAQAAADGVSVQVPAVQAAPVALAEEAPRAEAVDDGGHVEPEAEPCHHCGGSGDMPCGICGGDGVAPVDCPVCGGSGHVTVSAADDEPWVHPILLPCPNCGATGKVNGTCPRCAGVGSLPCANCGGSGLEPCAGGG